MEATATYDDVNLVLRLYELRREEKLRAARKWFAANFKPANLEEALALCPAGSEQDAYYRMVTSYWEMVASFVTCGVLNQELFFQSGGELLYVWERLRDLAPEVRARYQNHMAYKNLETVANAYIQWMEKHNPGAYAAFSARVRGR